MDTNRVAVATITWARSAAEEALLRRSLTLLAGAGMPVAIADTGTNVAFTAFLGTVPRVSVTVPNEQGLVAQAQASIAIAAKACRPFILYTEPDKAFFFEHRLRDFLRRVPDGADVGVALAARSAESFRSFPPMQRYAEGVINHLCGELVEAAGDYSYGPFVMNRALLPDVAALEPRLGWGWRHATFLAAHRTGLRVLHITSDHPCPEDQRSEDSGERLHRLRQLSQNILGLLGPAG
jgi:hypothetical protein